MTEEKMREALEKAIQICYGAADDALRLGNKAASSAAFRTANEIAVGIEALKAALSTKQEAGEVSRSQTEASLDQATQAPTATQVVSEALCRNNWSGFGTVCAGVCEACSIPSQPHACEHAVTVWGSDAQEILAALKQEGLVAGAEQDKPSSVCTPLPAPDAGWRTIDSAPRDGTWILIWHKNQHGNRPGISVAEPHVEYDLPADDASERMTWKNEAGYYQIHATHWLPLPAPLGDGSAPAEDSGPV